MSFAPGAERSGRLDMMAANASLVGANKVKLPALKRNIHHTYKTHVIEWNKALSSINYAS